MQLDKDLLLSVIKEELRDIKEKVPDFEITLHFHNTRGVGLANVLVGLDEGIDHYESCFGGIGGCPFAPDATGNICTEDLVYLMHEMNIDTGIDLNKLINIAKKAERILGYSLPGQVMHAGPRLKKYSPENEAGFNLFKTNLPIVFPIELDKILME